MRKPRVVHQPLFLKSVHHANAGLCKTLNTFLKLRTVQSFDLDRKQKGPGVENAYFSLLTYITRGPNFKFPSLQKDGEDREPLNSI